MRKRPLIIIWLDNLGAFHRFMGELGNIADAFTGGTAVKNLISVVPTVTETAELTIKAGCGLEEMPVVGEVTFDRETRAMLHLKETARFDDLVEPALARRLFTSFGFRTCQIGWKLGGLGPVLSSPGQCAPNVLTIESEEAVRLELEASYEIIPFRITSFINALREHEADIYLLTISGDSIVHNEAEAGQRRFMQQLDEEFPRLMAAIRAYTLDPTIIMFSDHPLAGWRDSALREGGRLSLRGGGRRRPAGPGRGRGEGRLGQGDAGEDLRQGVPLPRSIAEAAPEPSLR